MPAFTPVQHNLTYTETYNKRDSKIDLRHKMNKYGRQVHKDINKQMFKENWKRYKCLSTGDWLNNIM